MKKTSTVLATLVLALAPALASASAPAQPVQSNGTGHSNQYHDRTPRVHERTGSFGRR